MRIRSIKPEFWRSEAISSLDWETRFVFIGLWSYVDDNGVGVDRLALIAADLFADDLSADPTETLRRLSLALDALESGGRILRYSVNGKNYLYIVHWDEHQKVKNPNQPRYPLPESVTSGYVNGTEGVPTSSVDPTETLGTGTGLQGNRVTGEQGNRESGARKRATRLPHDWTPSESVRDQMRSEFPHLDLRSVHAKFVDYWIAKSGANALKLDWDATWRNWVRREAEQSPRGRPGFAAVQSRPPTSETKVAALQALKTPTGAAS